MDKVNSELYATFVPASPLTPALSPEYRGEGVGTCERILQVPPSPVRNVAEAMASLTAAEGEYRRQAFVAASRLLPPRFQRVRARGWKMPIGGKCCSRPGRWGNPFVGEWAARYFAFWAAKTLPGANAWRLCDVLGHAIVHGRELQLHQPTRWPLRTPAVEMFAGVTELAGRPLGCFCALDEACHVDTLLVLANELALRRAGHDPAELLRWQMGAVTA